MTTDPNRLIPIAHVMRVFGADKKTVLGWIDLGLPAIIRFRRVYFRQAELWRWTEMRWEQDRKDADEFIPSRAA